MIDFDAKLKRGAFLLDAKFNADDGITALFGPSGSGKSTILRMIAGLVKPEAGRIALKGTTVFDSARGVFAAPHRRRAALVFQDAQLFPHLDVRGNLVYAQSVSRSGQPAVAFDQAVAVLGLSQLLDRKPATLSGGERQRAAIGRALLSAPEVLLLDEPLSSLDAARKLEILPLIESVRDEFGVPIVYVSHSVEEVARLATSVVRIADGKVVTQGSPVDVLAPSASESGTDRFDAVSMLKAKVVRIDMHYAVTILAHPAGTIVIPGIVAKDQTEMRVAIRATNVTLSVGKPEGLSVRTVLEGAVRSIDAGCGPFAVVKIELLGGDVVHAFTTRLALAELKLAAGMKVFALAKSVAIDERGVAGVRG